MALALLIVFGLEPSEWLAIVGGALEILGFVLVAVELVRAQRHELGHAGPFEFLVTSGRWIRYEFRRLLGRVTIHEGAATLTGTVRLSGRGKVRSGSDSDDCAERLRVLEENFAALDQEVEQHRKELDQKIGKEADSLRSENVALRTDVEVKEAKAKEAFQNSATLQWAGSACSSSVRSAARPQTSPTDEPSKGERDDFAKRIGPKRRALPLVVRAQKRIPLLIGRPLGQ